MALEFVVTFLQYPLDHRGTGTATGSPVFICDLNEPIFDVLSPQVEKVRKPEAGIAAKPEQVSNPLYLLVFEQDSGPLLPAALLLRSG